MRIEIPSFALVALIGASSSGKSTFAKKHFLPTEILSSDFFRGMISDSENDQSVSADAFDLLYCAANKRLDRMKTTVIDATNLQGAARSKVIELAKKQNVHSVAIVLDLPESLLQERNRARADRRYPEAVIQKHCRDLRRCVKNLKREGFRFVYVLRSLEEIDGVEILRTRMYNDKKDLHGPFDIIGDVHGCFDELCALLEKLGYVKGSDGLYAHGEGRTALFLGDLCDRGPKNVEVLRLVMGMVRAGNALCVLGNHDLKLARHLSGKDVALSHGSEITAAQLADESEEFRREAWSFLDSLVSHYVLDGGRLAVSHAGLKEEYIGRGSVRVRDFCLYGETTGEVDSYGLPIRLNWAADYRGRATVVYGHTPSMEVQSLNNTHCIDTGCVFGGKLTALRYPEREFVSVNALRTYFESAKPLFKEENVTDPTLGDDMLTFGDAGGKLFIKTRLMPAITVNECNSAAALETMSRYAADPRWLIYLPPTMSPCETSPLDGYLEHPAEAIAYYGSRGVGEVVCEKKHMGSRAVIVLCKDAEVAARRFGVDDGTRGIIYTRTGRRFFENGDTERVILERLCHALTESCFWDEKETDWVCLDTELLPWSEKARTLLQRQYAPVGRAGRNALAAAVTALETTCRRENLTFEVSAETSGQNADPKSLLSRFTEKQQAVDGYVKAYREYCWSVKSVDDVRIAPFHLLATEGRVYSDKDHVWHMETLKRYCCANDPLFLATDYVVVQTTDEDSVRSGIDWWRSLTESGGEGMVVKPKDFIVKSDKGFLQPAVKCRGAEYLRIIYGPEYLLPEHLTRLKKRSLSRKRALALREFSLGMESLERFVHKEPLYRVHECVFAVLAFESEPVDPRL